jgi:hypothetical protein
MEAVQSEEFFSYNCHVFSSRADALLYDFCGTPYR